MALEGKRTENFDIIFSQGLPICVLSTSFQKSRIGWPQQLPTGSVSDISENLDFWWSVHRGLKLDGAIGQGEICNSEFSWIFTKTEFFEKNKSSKIS